MASEAAALGRRTGPSLTSAGPWGPSDGPKSPIIRSLNANEHGLYFSGQRLDSVPAQAQVTRFLIERFCLETGAKRFVAREVYQRVMTDHAARTN